VPAFTRSAQGPLPVLLVSFQNKLDKQGKVIQPERGQTQVYSKDEQMTADSLAQEFRDLMLPDMRLLDMIE